MACLIGEYMAIRQTKAGTWQVYWRNPITNKQESKTFKTRKEAKKEHNAILHRLSSNPDSFKKEEIINENNMTLNDLYKEYIINRFSESTLKKLPYKVKILLEQLGDKPLYSINQEDIENIIKIIESKSNLATTTIVAIKTYTKALIRFGQNKKLISNNIIFPSIKKGYCKKFIPPTFEEIQKIYKVAPSHLKRIVIIGAYFGVRVGYCELYQLTWNDVNFEKRVLIVHTSKKNKNVLYREIPIKESLIPLLQQWKDEDTKNNILNIIHYNGRLIEKGVYKSWYKTLKLAGITRHIRPYDLRHMFGTELVAAGTDIGTVAELMGHSDPMMLLKHYQYITKVQKRNAVEGLKDVLV